MEKRVAKTALNNEKSRSQNLGKDRIILGFLLFYPFNCLINFSAEKIIGLARISISPRLIRSLSPKSQVGYFFESFSHKQQIYSLVN